MKNNLFSCGLALLATILFAPGLFAQDFEVNGLEYVILADNPSCVAVYRCMDNESPIIKVPQTVTYQGNSYVVTRIGDAAFYRKLNVTSVELPNSLTHIGNAAFRECFNLVHIQLPDSLYSIGGEAFYNCQSLYDLEFPTSLRRIGLLAFSYTGWFSNQADGIVCINDLLYAYKGSMPEGTRIELPDSIHVICDWAFRYCAGLEAITLPDSLEYLGESSLAYTRLLSLSLPLSITEVPRGLCSDCYSLTTPQLHPGITKIGEGAFNRCTSLREVTLPDSLQIIDDFAFSNCTALERLKVPKKVTTIGVAAFYNCTNLQYVPTLGKQTRIIGSNAFAFCKQLTTLNMPDSLRVIGEEAFAYCPQLVTVNFGQKIEKVGGDAFRDTNWFYHNPWGVTYIGSVAYRYRGEMQPNTTIYIEDGTTYISDAAFKDCDGLQSIYIPASVASMGAKDGQGIFRGCTALKEVHLASRIPPVAYNNYEADYAHRYDLTLYVPYGCREAYKSDPYWGSFSRIFEDRSMNLNSVAMPEGRATSYDLYGRRQESLGGFSIIPDAGKARIVRIEQ